MSQENVELIQTMLEQFVATGDTVDGEAHSERAGALKAMGLEE